jgi:hypothetical protein
MFLKLMVENLLIRKQEPHIMQVLKFGEMSPMIIKAIFGHLVVFYMSLLVLNLHFKEKIWMNYLKIYKRTPLLQFPINIQFS